MKLSEMIETVRLLNYDEECHAYTTEDLVFFDSLVDIKNKNCKERIASSTDYAVMNYASIFDLFSDNKIKKPTSYWLRSGEYLFYEDCISSDGSIDFNTAFKSSYCSRPVLHLNLKSFISALSESRYFSLISKSKNSHIDDCYTLTYGQYPKSYVGDKLNNELESSMLKLRKTGKVWNGYLETPGKFVQNVEFEYNDAKYVRVKTKKFNNYSKYNDETKAPESGTYKWAKVEPMTWIIRNWHEMPIEINPNGNGKATFIEVQTEECVTSGIPFDSFGSPLWKKSDIRKFLNNEFIETAFSNDIVSVKNKVVENYNAHEGQE